MDWKTMLSYISGSVDEVCLLFIHPPAHGCRKSALRREIPWILRGFQGRLSC